MPPDTTTNRYRCAAHEELVKAAAQATSAVQSNATAIGQNVEAIRRLAQSVSQMPKELRAEMEAWRHELRTEEREDLHAVWDEFDKERETQANSHKEALAAARERGVLTGKQMVITGLIASVIPAAIMLVWWIAQAR